MCNLLFQVHFEKTDGKLAVNFVAYQLSRAKFLDHSPRVESHKCARFISRNISSLR